MADPFYVHIVESPSPEELIAGFTEGRALCSYLDIAQIPYLYNLAVDRPRFQQALSARFDEGCRRFASVPILHLSCHGNEGGIQLTEQRDTDPHSANWLIKWTDLADLVRPIHQSVGGLGVCMSCCGGLHAKAMAHVLFPTLVPFAWLVGTSEPIDLRDAALSFSVFYRFLQRGGDVSKVFEAMRVVSGNDFSVSLGHETHAHFSQKVFNLLKELNASKAAGFGPGGIP